MVLTVLKNALMDNDYVDVKYRELTPTISRIMDLCNSSCGWLQGEDGAQVHNIDINDILYVEWVDGKCCICTKDRVYTSAVTLSRLEELLSENSFVRVSKALLVNVYKVRWLSSGLNMKLVAELLNGERVIISRHYRGDLLDAIHAIVKEKKK